MYQIPEGIVYLDDSEVKLFDGRDHRVLFTVPDMAGNFIMVGRVAMMQSFQHVYHTSNVLHGNLQPLDTQENDIIIDLPDRFVQMKMFVTRISFDGLTWTEHEFSLEGLRGPYKWGVGLKVEGDNYTKYTSDGVEWKTIQTFGRICCFDAKIITHNTGAQWLIHETSTGKVITTLSGGPRFVFPYRNGFVGFKSDDIYALLPDGSWEKTQFSRIPQRIATIDGDILISSEEVIWVMREFNVFVPLCPGVSLHKVGDFIVTNPFRIVISKKWSYQGHPWMLPYVRLFARMLLLSFRKMNLPLIHFLEVMDMVNDDGKRRSK
jgi:hypothetical protein